MWGRAAQTASSLIREEDEDASLSFPLVPHSLPGAISDLSSEAPSGSQLLVPNLWPVSCLWPMAHSHSSLEGDMGQGWRGRWGQGVLVRELLG